jgi:hypothetical protein
MLVASLAWCLVGLGYALIVGDSAVMMVSGIIAGSLGVLVGASVLASGMGAAEDRRWRSDLRRGTATVHDPRPGEVSSSDATQALTCELEVRAAGMVTSRGRYRAAVGPVDAPLLVAGASFACQANPAVADQIRLWLGADPYAAELTGRHLDFHRISRTGS